MNRAFILVCVTILFNACSKTPDRDELLNQISDVSQSLAEAISSVPELREDNRQYDLALKKLSRSIAKHSDEYVSVLPMILKFGTDNESLIPVGAQTLFWIALDDNIELFENNLHRLTCERYINIGWNQFKPESRWDELDEVITRLSDPLLLDMYLDRQFSHSITKRGRWSNPTEIFQDKNGSCFHIAAFGVYFMKKAGYENCDIYWDTSVAPLPGLENLPYGHTVAAMKNSDETYIVFVDFLTSGSNRMSEKLAPDVFLKKYQLRTPGPEWMNIEAM